ncbi:Polynucleotidyl transferase, ribonuclease H-like superfamily protein, putative isoform 2 [Theobroma cacao]|uniref:Polynucleotidyl transferase, ribonuclease H-like superfamily protein, putative isoform 2 n=1 Tax=Theobroma cacao TaxID=3641 RepID=A0A061EBK0_THECC|nr:Polynucleotidyl transferase, ribonuclease H-like superfamily protein, putative isoform 2 [Theobroma cacao]
MLPILSGPLMLMIKPLANLFLALLSNQLLQEETHPTGILHHVDCNKYLEVVGSTSLFADPRMKHINLANQVETQMMPFNCQSYIVEFDGASKGNPGPAGAGAVLRAADGRVVCRLREGVGIATNNVAEYRGAILGMKCALKKGFKHIRVQGDSNLVCMQVQGRWKIKSQNLVELNKQAMELKDKFVSFQINHVDREFNSEADALANQGVNLMSGQVQEDWIM